MTGARHSVLTPEKYIRGGNGALSVKNRLSRVIKEQVAGGLETDKFAGKIYAVYYLKNIYSSLDIGYSHDTRRKYK